MRFGPKSRKLKVTYDGVIGLKVSYSVPCIFTAIPNPPILPAGINAADFWIDWGCSNFASNQVSCSVF